MFFVCLISYCFPTTFWCYPAFHDISRNLPVTCFFCFFRCVGGIPSAVQDPWYDSLEPATILLKYVLQMKCMKADKRVPAWLSLMMALCDVKLADGVEVPTLVNKRYFPKAIHVFRHHRILVEDFGFSCVPKALLKHDSQSSRQLATHFELTAFT